jgi:solute carrier family 31 (copper transporter), member 1
MLTGHAGFISSSWQIKSKGMFAGSCIGVICLVISLEFLRRVQRTYEAYLIQHANGLRVSAEQLEDNPSSSGSARSNTMDKGPSDGNSRTAPLMKLLPKPVSTSSRFRLSLPQQMIRALLHMVQFGVAYFIMLLAMYYNGYFIISILIGAFIGFFIFSWDTVQARRSVLISLNDPKLKHLVFYPEAEF